MKISSLKPGSVLSELSFYRVKEIKGNDVILLDDRDNEITLNHRYVEQILSSADYFSKEEKKTKTELAELFIKSSRVAMTVAFFKADQAKTKKAIAAETEQWTKDVKDAFLNKGISALAEFASKPVLDYIPGDLRVMKGRHYGDIDDLGRVHFVDMEIQNKPSASADARMRLVDPRTIQYIIVGGVKYTLK